ncbi:MAG: hypothetical protein NVSMB29_03690 [Candidatus Dormibacteria bacterium]
MAWPLVVAGTCHLDNVETPRGRREGQQGGSAVYFALAASRHVPVRVLSVVGSDTEASVRATLAGAAVDLRGLAVSARPTYRWSVRHDFENWVAVETAAPHPHSADDDWAPRLDADAAVAPVLFIASLPARLQLDVLRQSRAGLIGADTMTGHIAADGDGFEAVLEAADILFVNHHELRALVPASQRGWQETARSLCGRGRLRAVVVKSGPRGAACVTRERIVELPPHPTAAVVDPTGAGDALAGGFLGACAAAERDDEEYFGLALGEGVRAAALAIAGFGTDALRRPSGGAAGQAPARISEEPAGAG